MSKYCISIFTQSSGGPEDRHPREFDADTLDAAKAVAVKELADARAEAEYYAAEDGRPVPEVWAEITEEPGRTLIASIS